jgi:hypothetical protein
MYVAGPAGYFLNYADAGEKLKLGAPAAAMWLASAFQNKYFSDFIKDQLKARTAGVHHITWYRPYSSLTLNKSLDKYFGRDLALFLSRSSSTDPNALFLGVKAGYHKVNHAHLDLGNSEFDALGVSWARDLGSLHFLILLQLTRNLLCLPGVVLKFLITGKLFWSRMNLC